MIELIYRLNFFWIVGDKDDNELHPKNIEFILLTLLVFHFDISGKDFNELHSENI